MSDKIYYEVDSWGEVHKVRIELDKIIGGVEYYNSVSVELDWEGYEPEYESGGVIGVNIFETMEETESAVEEAQKCAEEYSQSLIPPGVGNMCECEDYPCCGCDGLHGRERDDDEDRQYLRDLGCEDIVGDLDDYLDGDDNIDAEGGDEDD